jgi:invasion protein IalB
MITMMRVLIWLLWAGSTVAHAQQLMTATYDQWTVSCADNKKVCQVVASQQTQGQSQIVSQITISGFERDSPLKVSIQVTPNVWLASGIKLITSNRDVVIDATFRWCVPGRCLADAEVKQDTLKKIGDHTDQPGTLVFNDATQHEQKISVSFKGFNSALAARPH